MFGINNSESGTSWADYGILILAAGVGSKLADVAVDGIKGGINYFRKDKIEEEKKKKEEEDKKKKNEEMAQLASIIAQAVATALATAPKAEAPKTEAPKTEAPKEEPKAEEKKTA